MADNEEVIRITVKPACRTDRGGGVEEELKEALAELTMSLSRTLAEAAEALAIQPLKPLVGVKPGDLIFGADPDNDVRAWLRYALWKLAPELVELRQIYIQQHETDQEGQGD